MTTATEPRCREYADLMQDPDQADVARYVCFPCPRLYACRSWALRTDVAGVCGGLTEAERDAWRHYARVTLPPASSLMPADVLAAEVSPGKTADPQLVAAVARLSDRYTASEIATRLGVTTRTVTRHRARSRQDRPAGRTAPEGITA